MDTHLQKFTLLVPYLLQFSCIPIPCSQSDFLWFGSRQPQCVQNWKFLFLPQQSPPSQLHPQTLLWSSQFPSPAHFVAKQGTSHLPNFFTYFGSLQVQSPFLITLPLASFLSKIWSAVQKWNLDRPALPFSVGPQQSPPSQAQSG